MAAKEYNLNFLNKCGWQTEYFMDSTHRRISISCHSHDYAPDLFILAEYYLPDNFVGKGLRRFYYIKSLNILYNGSEFLKILAEGALIGSHKETYYLVPNRALIEKILPIVDQNRIYGHLWQISRAILDFNETHLPMQRAMEILGSHIPNLTKEDLVNHPLLFKSLRDFISFTSRSMLEYCLGIELNKRNEHAQILKNCISANTQRFLDCTDDEMRIFESLIHPITQKKMKAVEQQRYEEAARLRDLEKEVVAAFLKKYWPDILTADTEAFLVNFMRESG